MNFERERYIDEMQEEFIIAKLDALNHKQKLMLENNIVDKVIEMLEDIILSPESYMRIKKVLDKTLEQEITDSVRVNDYINEFNSYFGKEPEHIEFIKKDEMVM